MQDPIINHIEKSSSEDDDVSKRESKAHGEHSKRSRTFIPISETDASTTPSTMGTSDKYVAKENLER